MIFISVLPFTQTTRWYSLSRSHSHVKASNLFPYPRFHLTGIRLLHNTQRGLHDLLCCVKVTTTSLKFRRHLALVPLRSNDPCYCCDERQPQQVVFYEVCVVARLCLIRAVDAIKGLGASEGFLQWSVRCWRMPSIGTPVNRRKLHKTLPFPSLKQLSFLWFHSNLWLEFLPLQCLVFEPCVRWLHR